MFRDSQSLKVAALATTIGTGLAAATPARADFPLEWTREIPIGTALSVGLMGTIVDDAGNTYITSIVGESQNTDILTAMHDTDGNLVWSHQFNGPENDHDQGRGLALSSDGFLYVVGNTQDSQNRSKVLLLKYDAADGTLINELQYRSDPLYAEYGGTVDVDDAGNVYVGGGTGGDGSDTMMIKFSPGGQFQWISTWDGPAWGPYSQDIVRQVKVTHDGNPVLLVDGNMSSNHSDYVLIKYDAANGDTIWETNWGLAGSESPTEMLFDAQGDIYVTGTALDFNNKYGTIKLNGTNGDLIWQKYDSAGIDDVAIGLALDGNGGVYITGAVDQDGNFSNFNHDFYTVKRDAQTGDFLWSHRYGDPCVGCFDVPSDIIVDPAGNVYLTGKSSSAPYSNDILTFKLDAQTGIELDRTVFVGAQNTAVSPNSLRLDARSNLYLTGQGYEYNLGENQILIAKYATQIGGAYQFTAGELIAGAQTLFNVTGAQPNTNQYLVYSIRGLGATPVPQLGIILDLDRPMLFASGRADANGEFAATRRVPFAAQGRRIWMQAAQSGQKSTVLSQTVR